MSGRQSVLAIVAVVVAAAAVAVVGSEGPHPVVPTARPVEQPIRTVTLSCPGSPGDPAPPSSVFAVGPGGSAAGGSTDRLEVVGASPGGSTLGSTTVPGRPVRAQLDDDSSQGGLVVDAAGALAPGAVAGQLSAYHSTTEQGLAETWCEAPREDWWFNGVDTSIGTSTQLVLSNPGPTVAVVDLHILGSDGVVEAIGGSAIPVAARSRRVLDLARYAPGQPALTVHVSATSGTVAAALSTTRLDGVTPAGADWVPASTSPSKSVVVDASVGGLGMQSLVIANPGTRQRLVSFRVLDQSGAYTSTDLPDLQVAPGSVVVKDVSAILDKQTTGFELTARGPVTGALVSQQTGGPRDFAVSGMSAPLTGGAVVPALNGTTVTLSFVSTTPGPKQVRVRAFDRFGDHFDLATVLINGAATTAWTPPDGWAAAYLVVNPPPRSDLHVVASYVGALGVTQLPLLSPPRTIQRPGVLPL